MVQDFTQLPEMHFGVSGLVHCAFVVHAGGAGVGRQTPSSHVKPPPHVAAVSHFVRHCPSAQTLDTPHSLEYLHVFWVGVQLPPTHVRPSPQSVDTVQLHGPSMPPQVWQVPPLQAWPDAQSLLVEHSFTGPGSVPGAVQTSALHFSPLGHGAPPAQLVAQPVEVQTEPAPQLAVPVHAARAGGVTDAQP